jgi:hypothetical protein
LAERGFLNGLWHFGFSATGNRETLSLNLLTRHETGAILFLSRAAPELELPTGNIDMLLR